MPHRAIAIGVGNPRPRATVGDRCQSIFTVRPSVLTVEARHSRSARCRSGRRRTLPRCAASVAFGSHRCADRKARGGRRERRPASASATQAISAEVLALQEDVGLDGLEVDLLSRQAQREHLLPRRCGELEPGRRCGARPSADGGASRALMPPQSVWPQTTMWLTSRWRTAYSIAGAGGAGDGWAMAARYWRCCERRRAHRGRRR